MPPPPPPPPPARPRCAAAHIRVSPRAIVVKSEIERAIVLKSEIERPIVLGHAPIVQGPIVFISETNRPIVLGSIVFMHQFYNYSKQSKTHYAIRLYLQYYIEL